MAEKEIPKTIGDQVGLRRGGEPDIEHVHTDKCVWLGGRGVRLTPAQKRRAKKFLLERDGPRCMLCKREVSNPDTDLQLDHMNGDAGYHWSCNMQLSHAPCNSRAFNLRKEVYYVGPLSIQPQRERGRLAPQFEHPPASVEVGLNREYEPLFRRKCFEMVKDAWHKKSPVSKKTLRIKAREIVGCSQQTSYSYIERLIESDISPLTEEVDILDGSFYVRFRDPKDLNLSIEELELKYPKTGQRFKKEPELK